MKKFFISANNTEAAAAEAKRVEDMLLKRGFELAKDFDDSVDMILAIGGDGSFLTALKNAGYPDTPVLGINTGHLGFFQELSGGDEEDFDELLSGKGYALQTYRLLCAQITEESGVRDEFALNDICVKARGLGVVKLMLSVGEHFVEHFCGDGFIVASSAGSTGYNYSLGGCIVDPRLEALQVAPIAPINNRAYRSFTSGLMFPPEYRITIKPDGSNSGAFGVYADGRDISADGKISSISVSLSDKKINVVRRNDYDFWSKVESKLL